MLQNADLIISIGWQSTALKASSIFKKPLLFYSKNGYPYNKHSFSFNQNKIGECKSIVNQI